MILSLHVLTTYLIYILSWFFHSVAYSGCSLEKYNDILPRFVVTFLKDKHLIAFTVQTMDFSL